MAAVGNSCFWLVNFENIFTSEKCFINSTLHEGQTLIIGLFSNIARSIKSLSFVQRGIDKTFFRSEDIFEIDQPETRIAYGSHIC
jgi:hypothetical protein